MGANIPVLCYCTPWTEKGRFFLYSIQQQMYLSQPPQPQHSARGGERESPFDRIRCEACDLDFASLEVARHYHNNVGHQFILPEFQAPFLYETELGHSILYLQPREVELAVASLARHRPDALPRLLLHVEFESSRPHTAVCIHKEPRDHCCFCQYAANSDPRLVQLFHAKTVFANELLGQGVSSPVVLKLSDHAIAMAKVHFYRLFLGNGRSPSCHCQAINHSFPLPPPPSRRLPEFKHWLGAQMARVLLHQEVGHVHTCANCHSSITGKAMGCRLCTEQGLLVTAYYCKRVCQKKHWPTHRFFHSLLLPNSLPRIFIRIPLAMFDAPSNGDELVHLIAEMVEGLDISPSPQCRLALNNTAAYRPLVGLGVYKVEKAREWLTTFSQILGPQFQDIMVRTADGAKSLRIGVHFSTAEFSLTATGIFKSIDNQTIKGWPKRLKLRAESPCGPAVDWIRFPDVIISVSNQPTVFSLTVIRDFLFSGTHQAEVQGYVGGVEEMGPILRFPVSITLDQDNFGLD